MTGRVVLNCDALFLQNAPIDVVKAVYQVSFDPVVKLILQSNDQSEMQVI